jgi:hypothetical protein
MTTAGAKVQGCCSSQHPPSNMKDVRNHTSAFLPQSKNHFSYKPSNPVELAPENDSDLMNFGEQ